MKYFRQRLLSYTAFLLTAALLLDMWISLRARDRDVPPEQVAGAIAMYGFCITLWTAAAIRIWIGKGLILSSAAAAIFGALLIFFIALVQKFPDYSPPVMVKIAHWFVLCAYGAVLVPLMIALLYRGYGAAALAEGGSR